MKSLIEFITESVLKLPYNFDIYNAGPKNKNFSITKKNIYKLYFKLADYRTEKISDTQSVSKRYGKVYDSFIKLPLPAEAIVYKQIPTKSSTENWTKVPEIADYMYAGAWYSDKFAEYNHQKYDADWEKWLNYIAPFMKGKISTTLKESDDKDNVLEIVINNEKFNADREAKIKELSNPELLKQWSDEADAKEKAEIKKRAEEEAEKERKEKEWNDWWNGLSDEERLAWTMGYGRNLYQGD